MLPKTWYNKCPQAHVPNEHKTTEDFKMSDLITLAKEYEQSANLLEHRLNQLKSEAPGVRGLEALKLQKRMETLTAELYHTRKMRAYLLNYYS